LQYELIKIHNFYFLILVTIRQLLLPSPERFRFTAKCRYGEQFVILLIYCSKLPAYEFIQNNT